MLGSEPVIGYETRNGAGPEGRAIKGTLEGIATRDLFNRSAIIVTRSSSVR